MIRIWYWTGNPDEDGMMLSDVKLKFREGVSVAEGVRLAYEWGFFQVPMQNSKWVFIPWHSVAEIIEE